MKQGSIDELELDERFDDMDLEVDVSRLPADVGKIIKLYYLYGYTGQEIADMLGVTRRTVSRKLKEGRESLGGMTHL